MQAINRWRNLANLRNYVAFSVNQAASIHSTAVCDAKSTKKWHYDFVKNQEKVSKKHIRYVTREKRADTKKALKNLLYNSGAFECGYEHNGRSKKKTNNKSSWDGEFVDEADSQTNKGGPKSRREEKVRSKLRRRLRRGYPSDDDDERLINVFQSTFDKWYSRRFDSYDGPSFESFTSGFEWREGAHTRKTRHKSWESPSDLDSEDEQDQVGSYSDRVTLGLAPFGPLKMEDVKSAFRQSALKWHPDKHQGPSQAQAEEKFKLCVDAYKSLCTSLSAAS